MLILLYDRVISRLRGLGWGPELDRLAKKGYVLLREQKQMRVAKKVTDRGTSKTLRTAGIQSH